jgi:hypothetical protein
LPSRWPNKSIFFSLLIIKKRLKIKKMLVEKKWVKKLPSWQANNFSDLNFLFVKFSWILKKWRENCEPVDRVSAWKIFGFF